jgi:hypothetical protein
VFVGSKFAVSGHSSAAVTHRASFALEPVNPFGSSKVDDLGSATTETFLLSIRNPSGIGDSNPSVPAGQKVLLLAWAVPVCLSEKQER